MTKKLMLLAAGALAALAFAALPAGASAEEVQAHCAALPCEAVVQSTGNAQLFDTNGNEVLCKKTTGSVKQEALTSTTVKVSLTFDECNNTCENDGAGKIKMEPDPVTGHLITIVKGDPTKVGVLLTNIHTTFKCAFGLITKTVTGNIIGTITNPQCGVAATHHTISFTQTQNGHQTHKTWTGGTFDLDSNGVTASEIAEAHLNYAESNKVTLTC
jgi:hypothetical protein